MTVNFSQAVAAYNRALSKTAEAGSGLDAPQTGANFSDLLAKTLNGAVEAGHQSEQVSLQAIANKADLNEIVTAVTSAEVTLQTVVAIRDRVIQAYQDIIRMPI